MSICAAIAVPVGLAMGGSLMYDGTDVALVLGGILAGVLAVLSLFAALASLTVFVFHRAKKDGDGGSFSGRLAVYFAASGVLCGISIASGYVIYNLFEHTRGHSNPPTHVLAVAIGSLWGPVAAGILGLFCLRKRT
jgi:hypothetical protein